MEKLVKNIFTGKKVLVEYAATINKVKYYVEVNNPDRIHTQLEIRELKKY